MSVKKEGIHWYLSDDEVLVVRKELEELRQFGRYAPDKSFVSGLNFLPDVLSVSLPDHWPTRVMIRDITLRTAEQVAGIAMSPRERKRLAQGLVDIGISSIQLTLGGWQTPLEQVEEEIRYIKELNPAVEIPIGGLDTVEAMDRFFAVGVDVAQMTVPAAVAISPFYIGSTAGLAWSGRDWRVESGAAHKTFRSAIEQLKRLVDHAHKCGKKMETKLSMLLYATPEIIDEFTREMGDAGADIIALQDGPSAMTPNAIAYAVLMAKRNAPDSKIAIHLHNTFGLGIALNLAAAQAGAEIFEVAVNGYCGGPGQADEQQVIAALEVLCGVDTGVDLQGLTNLRRLGEDITRMKVSPNHPITGDEAFNWGGGDLLMLELDVDPLIHQCMDASLVGNKRSASIEGAVVDRSSGPWSVANKLVELGFDVEKEEVDAVHKELHRELLVRKRCLTNDEICQIVANVIATRP